MNMTQSSNGMLVCERRVRLMYARGDSAQKCGGGGGGGGRDCIKLVKSRV